MHRSFWVFGYGSLMWRPGFEYQEAHKAILHGYSRSFCVYSHYYRGTPERPGLVLGLDPKEGSSCQGMAFRVPMDHKSSVVAYLTERELCGYAYKAETLPLVLECQTEVEGYCFVADPEHSLYAGYLSLEKAAYLIMQASGETGLNRDYLINTVRELEANGYCDEHLHELLKTVEYQTGLIEAGGGI